MSYEVVGSRKRKAVYGTNFGFESLCDWRTHSLPFLAGCVDVTVPVFDEYGVCVRCDVYQLKYPPIIEPIYKYLADEITKEDFQEAIKTFRMALNDLPESSESELSYLKEPDLRLYISKIISKSKFLKARMYGLLENLKTLPEFWLTYLCFDRSCHEPDEILRLIKAIPTVITPRKLRRHFSLTLSPDRFSTFLNSSAFRNLQKISFSVFNSLNLIYRETYPYLFSHVNYNVYERQNSGFLGILNHLNTSQADDLFHAVVNLSYELSFNLKHSILYQKTYPLGHQQYLSSIYSLKLKKSEFKFCHSPQAEKKATTVFADADSTSGYSNTELACSSSNILDNSDKLSSLAEFDKLFSDLLLEMPLPDNLKRIPDFNSSFSRIGNLYMKNNRVYRSMLELNLGKNSPIFDSTPGQISDLQIFHGKILLKLIFATNVSRESIWSLLTQPNLIGYALNDIDFIPLDFLKKMASGAPLTTECRLKDYHINFILDHYLTDNISKECFVGDTYFLAQIFRTKSRGSRKIWAKLLGYHLAILPYHIEGSNEFNHHWSLVICYRENQVLNFHMFNSIYCKYSSDLFLEKLKDSFTLFLELSDSADLYRNLDIRVSSKFSYLQLDAHSCGYYVLFNALSLILGHVPVDPSKILSDFRLNLCSIFLDGEPKFSS